MNSTIDSTQTQRTILTSFQEDYLTVWFEAFLRDRKVQNLADGSIRFYTQKLQEFGKYCDGQQVKLVTEITSNFIRDYLFYMEDKGHAPGGIHASYRTIKTFLNWYENEAEPTNWKNPIKKVKSPKVPELILEPVEIETIFQLETVCEKDTFTGIRDKAILLMLLDTGARANEFLSIDLKDIDMVNGSILIRKGKGRKMRYVGLGQKSRKAVRAYLKLRKDNLPALWIRDDSLDRLGYDGLRSIVVRRSELLKIKPPSLHSFRRAFAINFLRNGGDLMTLAKLLGHTTLLVCQKYLKLLPGDLIDSHKKYSPVDNSKLK